VIGKNELKEFAFSQGAQLVAFTGVDSYDEYLEEVQSRLEETGAGHEDYLVPAPGDNSGSADELFFAQLSDPRDLLPGAKSMIILGVYANDPTGQYGNTKRELRGKTARTYYYYPVIRQIAEKVVVLLEKSGHQSIHGQHIPLKFVSNQTGLGVYGKNGILQHPQYGSFIALRNIITEADFTADQKQKIPSPCKGCDKCIKACPTGALYAPYKVNPSLCINPVFRREEYISPLMRSRMQNWVVGCDICQEVCPYNKRFAIPTGEAAFQAALDHTAPPLLDLIALDLIHDTIPVTKTWMVLNEHHHSFRCLPGTIHMRFVAMQPLL